MNKVTKYKLKLKMPKMLDDGCNYLKKRTHMTPFSRSIRYELGALGMSDLEKTWDGTNEYIATFTMEEIHEILTADEIGMFDLIKESVELIND